MISTLDHTIDSSLYLWLDYTLLNEARGFRNYSGNFLQGTENPVGVYAYDAPHRQFVYDSSVSGATVISNVYVGGISTPKGTGASSMRIDYARGQALFLSPVSSTVSGVYSYKDVNLYPISVPAEHVLFENKFAAKPKYDSVTSWKGTDQTYPLIFIKADYGDNTTLCFDNLASSTFPYRLTLLTDTAYLMRAVCSILRDKKETFIPIFNNSEIPFTELGDIKGGAFHYQNARASIQTDSNRLARIISVKISPFNDRVNILIGPRVFGAFIDITLELFRFPHG